MPPGGSKELRPRAAADEPALAAAHEPALAAAANHAAAFLRAVPTRPVGVRTERTALEDALAAPLPDEPSDPVEVLDRLVDAAGPGLLGSQSPRFFGFVIGGGHPVALAADWLTATWDQNAALYACSPAAAVAERVAGDWLLDLLGLPAECSVGFVTGGQMATWTCLLAARHRVLADVGWSVERSGLAGAPPVHVVAGAERHGTVDRAVQHLGLGTEHILPVAVDAQGRMEAEHLADVLEGLAGPTIVVTEAGNVNSGAVDPLADIVPTAHIHGAWVHVDGAFGLWARASARTRALTAGLDAADSWSVDAHKWLNVPYDSGIAVTRHPEAHLAALGHTAAYLPAAEEARHDPSNWTPELSRRARGFAVWATLRALGRRGVADLVDRLCARARQFAAALAAADGVEVLNDVVLNQVLVRLTDGVDADAHTREVVERVQREGTCWMSGTTWQGAAAMRISVSNWATTEEDVDRSVAAVLRCHRG